MLAIQGSTAPYSSPDYWELHPSHRPTTTNKTKTNSIYANTTQWKSTKTERLKKIKQVFVVRKEGEF
jgi:hypothetical protein